MTDQQLIIDWLRDIGRMQDGEVISPMALQAADEMEDLRQFKEWAEPQCEDYAANRMEIEGLRANLDAGRAELAWAQSDGRKYKAALERVSKVLAMNMQGSTHWTGCESVHWICQIGNVVETALGNEANAERRSASETGDLK